MPTVRQRYGRGPVAVLCGIVLTVAVFAAPAPARAAMDLPFKGMSGIAVDDVNKHVFVTGSLGTKVAIADFHGNKVKVIDLGSQTGGIAINGSIAYVAMPGLDTIATIDTTTLIPGPSFTLPNTMLSPNQLAISSGMLWIGWGDCSTTGGIAALDTTTGDVTVSAATDYAWMPSLCPRSDASLALPDRLLLWDHFGPGVTVVDTSGATPAKVGSIDGITGGVSEAAISANGSRILVADYAYGVISEYASSDLGTTGNAYHLRSGRAMALAVSSTDEVVIAGSDQLMGYQLEGVDPVYESPLTSWFSETLALSADGLHGFEVTGSSSPRLVAFGPRQVATSMSLRVSANRVHFGESFRLTVDLLLGPDATNHRVTLYQQVIGEKAKVVAKKSVDSSGRLSVSVTPAKSARYWAEYAGDTFDQATASATRTTYVYAKVTGQLKRYYATSSGYRLYHFARCKQRQEGCPTYEIVVRPNRAGRSVDYHLQAFYDGAWRTVYGGGLDLSPKSTATVSLVFGDASSIGVRYRIRGEYAADNQNLAGKSEWAYFKLTS